MNFYLNAPIWDKNLCPSLSATAIEKNSKTVKAQRVIKVVNAMYRNAEVSGTFVLAPSVKLPLGKVGKKRVEVYCCWFGHKLKSEKGIKLLVQLASAEVKQDYVGEVVTNIAK
jgi:hypothetical protein